VDFLSSPMLQVGAIAFVGVVAVSFMSRRWQRCPHCHRMVPRAKRGWLRCRNCGRQYHRSVHLR
jgi:hypothetical protein